MVILCLASSSISRKKVLDGAEVNYLAITSDVDENLDTNSPEDLVSILAERKARAVIDKTDADLILGADSIAFIDGKIIGKPKNEDHALKILTSLQNNTHTFLSGIFVYNTKSRDSCSTVVKTRVTLAPLSPAQITAYVKKFQPFRYAGGYDNSISSWFIDRINGSQSNLMGLPMVEFRQCVETLGYHWIDLLR